MVTKEEVETIKKKKKGTPAQNLKLAYAAMKGDTHEEEKLLAERETEGLAPIQRTLTPEEEERIKQEVTGEPKTTTPKQTTIVKRGEKEFEVTKAEPAFLPELSKALGLPEQKGFKQAFRETAPKIAESAAGIIDAVGSIFSARKQADVLTAESSFTDAITQLTKDIEDVRTGAKTHGEAVYNIELARNALSRLESSQKGLGQANLRYWLGGGAEVEAEIIIFKNRIADLQNELEIARQEQIGLRRQALAFSSR